MNKNFLLGVCFTIMASISGVANAKQIAVCSDNSGATSPWGLEAKSCYIMKPNGNTGYNDEVFKVRGLGHMYSQGWRLITVVHQQPQNINSSRSFFYFEK